METPEGLLPIIIVAFLAAGGMVLWRRPRRRPRSVAEAIERQALDREAEHQLDDAIYHSDRYNLRKS